MPSSALRDLIKPSPPPRIVDGYDDHLYGGKGLTSSAQEAISKARLWNGTGDAIPWYTPVIGSGPVGLPADFRDAARHLPEAMQLKLSHSGLGAFAGPRPLAADPMGWIGDFVGRLVDDRAGGFKDRESQRPVPVERLADRLTDLALRVTAVAAQLTRTFHRISLDVTRPIGPWGSESAVLPRRHARWASTDEDYLATLRTLIDWAQDALAEDSQRLRGFPALKGLLEQIRLAANENKVTLHHVQQVTEVSWWLIVESVVDSPYPGWTELLLQLLLKDSVGVNSGHRRPRLLDMEKLASSVSELLNGSTAASWRGVNLSTDTLENRRFYDAVAGSLWAQHAFAEREKGEGGVDRSAVMAPFATGFVTSFDYELEMALWRTAPASGGGFSVVLPAYLVHGDKDTEGDFVWMAGTIIVPREDERVGKYLEDRESAMSITTWGVLSSHHSLPKHPIVVRLAGCPLVDLADVAQKAPVLNELRALGLVTDASAGERLRLVHAITVDEYLAVRQTEAEWQWTRELMNDKPGGRGLPKELTLTRGTEPVRYWLLMGVPLKDPAIRMRVLAVLARDEREQEAARSTAEPAAHASDHGSGPTAAGIPAARVRATGGSLARWGITDDRKAVPQPSVREGRAAQAPEPTQAAPTRSPRAGLAINTRCDDDEVILMQSLGLTIVRDRCERYTDDLENYVTWLAKQSLQKP